MVLKLFSEEVAMKVCLLSLLVLVLSGCLPEPLAVVTSQDVQNASDTADNEEVVESIVKSTESSDERVVVVGKFSFSTPVSWFLEVLEPKEKNPRDATYVVRVQDTNSVVNLGAVAVEDCALDESSCDFVTDYSVFQVFVYEGEVDFSYLSWTDFFADYYPEVLTFEPLVLSAKPELNAVVVTKVDGPWLGVKRVFVHESGSFLDFSLHTTLQSTQAVEVLFWNFVANFKSGGE